MALIDAEIAPRSLPAPTRDIGQAERDLREHGLAIMPDVLDRDMLSRARDALYRAADDDRRRGREQKFVLDYEQDSTTSAYGTC